MRKPVAAKQGVIFSVMLAIMLVLPMVAIAHSPSNQHFSDVWTRTDEPVSTGHVSRTWIWGPGAFTQSCYEPYLDAPAGDREVQYFEKSRMEITDPGSDVDPTWFVTQGLLASELMSGNMQVGDSAFIDWGPADVHIAGDPGGGAPSYAVFGELQGQHVLEPASLVTRTIDVSGLVDDDPAYAAYGVTADEYVDATGHNVASVFWEFMNSSGPVQIGGSLETGPVFENPFYAVGFPLTEAYWSRIEVGGVEQDVLIQAFERRVLTYTPGNDAGWEVEAGNVGQHYYIWRYGEIPSSGDGCPDTLKVTFHVYQPVREDRWEQVAVTRTHEVWHPNGVATGIWRAYQGSNIDEDFRQSSGTMIAHHTYQYVFPGNFLVELDAEIQEIVGPSGGTATIKATNFRPSIDPRIPDSIVTGHGWVSYDTGTEQDVIEFEVVGTADRAFHVFLDGEAPPVFFSGN